MGFILPVVPANAGTHTPRPRGWQKVGVAIGRNNECLWLWVPAFAGTTAKLRDHCVFATRGGAAVVTKLVASSIAGPNGVGIVMRNGTRIRVPAIGTKAISMLRWAARCLITGRSGI